MFSADALLFQMQVRVTFADPACASSGQRESALDYTPAQVASTPVTLQVTFTPPAPGEPTYRPANRTRRPAFTRRGVPMVDGLVCTK